MALANKQSGRLPGGGGVNRTTGYSRRLAHLRTTLAPLVSVTDRTVHADFPATLLQYHLLTSPQLDALARHYHQSSPRVESWGYPVSVVGRWTALPSSPSPPHLDINAAIMGLEPTRTSSGDPSAGAVQKASVHDRRRRFGRFIGLRGCESPGLSAEEAMRAEEQCVDLWVEREAMRRVRREEGPKGLMF